jgi:hypothetical protein
MTSANVSSLIQSRYSVRGFTPDPVPEDAIREVVRIAGHSPSNSNTQPWHLAIVSGAARTDLETRVFNFIRNGGTPQPAFPPGGAGLTGVYKDRQYDCAFRYYDTMGIARNDIEGRQCLLERNWKFFGAPHAAFLSMPKSMHRANAIDLGIFLQSLMLLFAERGIATCPQGALAAFPDIVREVVEVPEDNAIMCGLSFGYEAEGERINTVRMPREPLDTILTFAT